MLYGYTKSSIVLKGIVAFVVVLNYFSSFFTLPATFFTRKSRISSGFVLLIPKYSGKSFVVVSISVVPCFFV